MRIHALTLRGIGPFAHRQHIDFDALGEQGLFLLDGPTGVGKSTVVDAIVFALFGSPATEDGQDRMVSDFLGHDIKKADRPFVELTFSTSEGTFRVHREPKSPYLNRKGEIALHNASVRLTRLPNETAPDGELVSTSAPEVGNEVTRLLGLNRDQVLSTIVLAQGQFARFLKARTEDRRAILQSVFNTQRYEQVQNALVDARKAANVWREDCRRVLTESLSAFVEAAGLQVDHRELAEQYPASHAVLDERVTELGAQAQQAGTTADLLTLTAQRAATDLVEGKQRLAAITSKRELLHQHAALQREQAEVQQVQAQIDAARAASLVAASETAALARARELERAQRELREVLTDLDSHERELRADDLDELVVAIAEQVTALAEPLAVELGLADRRAHRDEQHQHAETLARSIAAAQEELAQLPEQIAALQVQHEQLRQVAATLPVAQKDLADVEAAQDLMVRVDGLRDALAKAKEHHAQAADIERVAEDALLAARRQHREGLAAELALTMREGEACPVCGSGEHPRPARAGQGHVSAEQVQALDDQWRRDNRSLQIASSEMASLLAEVQSKEELLTWTDREEVHLACKTAAERVDQAQQAARDMASVTTALTQRQSRLQELWERRAHEREQQSAATQRLLQLRTQLEFDEQRVHDARAGFACVAARDAHLRARRHLIKSAADARRAEETIAHSWRDAADQYEQALSASPFPDELSYLAAKQSAEWVTANATRVRNHGEAWQSVLDQLAAMLDVDETEQVDLAALQVAADSAAAQANAAVAAHGQLSLAHERTMATMQRVQSAWAACETAVAQTAAIIRLADLASGGRSNLHGIKLATYVVKRRFAEVVDAANTHLAVMSDGRYRLETSDGPDGPGRTHGLGLNIYDDRTDAPRGPSTLSGGETFYVSLSLALGLADVVQSEAGGITIDTLFVDEGFGSLDSETLDTVMNVLTRLSRGHRTVGLISHVDEMKRRIPDRVQIHRPDPNGPSEVRAGVG